MTAPSHAQSRYRLADHVRACHVDGQVILLDLKRSKYVGVAGPLLAEASAIVVDWPGRTADDIRHSRLIASDQAVSALVRQGLLVDALSAPASPPMIEAPLETLGELNSAASAGIRLHCLASVCASAFVTARWIRRLSMASIADKVVCLRPAGWRECLLAADLQRTVCSYLRMRPLVMTAHDRCLHDSLTLVRFLAAEGHYARWVVGVRTRPFAAHSWVQSGSLVLNDLHERVRGYTPILVV